MRFIIAATLALSCACLVPQVRAQAPAPGTLTKKQTAPDNRQTLRNQQTLRPLFTLGGIEGVVSAPTLTPDSGRAYQTFEGQPATGKDDIAAQARGRSGR